MTSFWQPLSHASAVRTKKKTKKKQKRGTVSTCGLQIQKSYFRPGALKLTSSLYKTQKHNLSSGKMQRRPFPLRQNNWCSGVFISGGVAEIPCSSPLHMLPHVATMMLVSILSRCLRCSHWLYNDCVTTPPWSIKVGKLEYWLGWSGWRIAITIAQAVIDFSSSFASGE